MKTEIVPFKTISFHKDMVHALAKPERAIISGLVNQEDAAHILHMAIGVAGEVGELLENLLDELGRENLVEEIGDIEFYMRGLSQAIGYKDLLKSHKVILGSDLAYSTAIKAATYASIRASQLLDAIKKMAIYEKALDKELAFKAFTGLLYCIESVRVAFDITRTECLEHNISKLGKRYSGGTYTNLAAQVRADKTEGE
jgi:hypothetical protein